MAVILGSGEHRYRVLEDWAKLPEHWNLTDVASVAVDSKDRVYVFNRGDHPMVVLQIHEMRQQIKTDASDKKWWDYRDLYNRHSARRRLICVLGMACFGQLSGNSVSLFNVVDPLVHLPLVLPSSPYVPDLELTI